MQLERPLFLTSKTFIQVKESAGDLDSLSVENIQIEFKNKKGFELTHQYELNKFYTSSDLSFFRLMCPEIVLEDDEIYKMITCEMLIKDSKKNESRWKEACPNKGKFDKLRDSFNDFFNKFSLG